MARGCPRTPARLAGRRRGPRVRYGPRPEPALPAAATARGGYRLVGKAKTAASCAGVQGTQRRPRAERTAAHKKNTIARTGLLNLTLWALVPLSVVLRLALAFTCAPTRGRSFFCGRQARTARMHLLRAGSPEAALTAARRSGRDGVSLRDLWWRRVPAGWPIPEHAWAVRPSSVVPTRRCSDTEQARCFSACPHATTSWPEAV